MLTLGQKALVTVVVLAMNAAVFVFLSWFVVVTLVPSLLFLGVVLRR